MTSNFFGFSRLLLYQLLYTVLSMLFIFYLYLEYDLIIKYINNKVKSVTRELIPFTVLRASEGQTQASVHPKLAVPALVLVLA